MDQQQISLLAEQLKGYYNNEIPFQDNSSKDQLHYWKSMTMDARTSAIKALAIKLYELVIHARGVESLFSIMKNFKSLARNRMSTKTMEMMAQLKLVLLEKPKNSSNYERKARIQNVLLNDVSEREIMEVFDTFMLTEQVKKT